MVFGAPHRFRSPRPNRLVHDLNAEVVAQIAINARQVGSASIAWNTSSITSSEYGLEGRQHFIDKVLHAFGSIRHGLISARRPPDK